MEEKSAAMLVVGVFAVGVVVAMPWLLILVPLVMLGIMKGKKED